MAGSSSNNVLTLRIGYAAPRSPGFRRHIHSLNRGRERPDRAAARLEQLRVNGRREHGNVMKSAQYIIIKSI